MKSSPAMLGSIIMEQIQLLPDFSGCVQALTCCTACAISSNMVFGRLSTALPALIYLLNATFKVRTMNLYCPQSLCSCCSNWNTAGGPTCPTETAATEALLRRSTLAWIAEIACCRIMKPACIPYLQARPLLQQEWPRLPTSPREVGPCCSLYI